MKSKRASDRPNYVGIALSDKTKAALTAMAKEKKIPQPDLLRLWIDEKLFGDKGIENLKHEGLYYPKVTGKGRTIENG